MTQTRRRSLVAGLTLLAGAALLIPGARAPQAATPLLAAYAEADVTPPLGGSMPGYFGDRQATGILDPLKSKVLLLRKGDESIALVSLDLIGVGAGLVRQIREEVKRTVSPAPKQVWVHATHTHTGGMVPRTDAFTSDAEKIYPGFYPGRVDDNWIGELVRKTAGAVGRAAGELKDESRITLHEGKDSSVAFVRRFRMKDGTVRTNPGRNNPNIVAPMTEIDPRLSVLRFEKSRTLAVMYGLHPDCVSGTRYSADYPAHLAEALKASQGPDWRVIFFNACCGNINHINVNDPNQKSGPEESQRIGQVLAKTAAEGLSRPGQSVGTDQLRARTRSVTCRLRKPSEAEVQEAEERLRTGKNTMEFNGLFAPAVVILAKTADREHTAEIGALRIGSFGLATFPGEVFVELTRETEQASPFRPTRAIGLTNGSMGYIPTRQAYSEGGYEAGYRSARYEPDNGHNWAKAAASLLQEMGR